LEATLTTSRRLARGARRARSPRAGQRLHWNVIDGHASTLTVPAVPCRRPHRRLRLNISQVLNEYSVKIRKRAPPRCSPRPTAGSPTSSADQESIFRQAPAGSAVLAARARNVLAGGSPRTGNHRAAAVWLSHGAGARYLRRRRQRVRGPARRVRRGAGRPRAPGDRRRGPRPGRPGHALRPADRERDRGASRSGPPVGPAAAAVCN